MIPLPTFKSGQPVWHSRNQGFYLGSNRFSPGAGGHGGVFGTLPDGLLMYFDRSPAIADLEIFGVGQPLYEIPDEIYQKMRPMIRLTYW
jgi:hypothetical protein